MNNKLFIPIFILFSIFVSGCASSIPNKVETKEVNIPVAVCPRPPDVEEYAMEINKIPDNASYDQISKAVRIDLVALKKREEMLLQIIKQYEQ